MTKWTLRPIEHQRLCGLCGQEAVLNRVDAFQSGNGQQVEAWYICPFCNGMTGYDNNLSISSRYPSLKPEVTDAGLSVR